MKQGELYYNASIDRVCIQDIELHCGDCIEIQKASGEWIPTRIEKSINDWYLVGIKSKFAELIKEKVIARIDK